MIGHDLMKFLLVKSHPHVYIQILSPASIVFPQMQPEIKGFILVTISALCFSAMSFFAKSCSLGPSQVVFARSVFQALFCAILCKWNNLKVFGDSNIKHLLILRGLFGGLGVGMYFYGMKYGNMGDATAVYFTAPAITTILSGIFLGQTLGLAHFLSITLCTIGTILVARPPFFGFPDEKKDENMFAIIICMIGAIVSAFAYLLVPIIGNRAHHMQLAFYFGFMSSFVVLIPMFVNGFEIPNLTDCAYLTGVVFFAVTGQSTLNEGLQLASSSASLMRNLDVVFAFLYSHFIFDEGIHLYSIIGAIVIICGTGIIFYEKWRVSRKQDDFEEEIEPLLENEENNAEIGNLMK
eukprot:NODE_1041_length_2490_cov_1.026767.p1 type:complete len:351 gc:universal NODE_1041_length_2490_cov_1.026767:484-1536(+)